MENLVVLMVAVVAGMVTYYISIMMNKGAVFGSAVVTLISGIVLPHFFPIIGPKLAVVATCASYAGMVAVKNVPKLWEMASVSFIAGGLFILSSSVYIGVGGKLGTIAALACFAWIGCKKAYEISKGTSKQKTVKTKTLNQL